MSCPNCGYCPHCGRSNWQPQVWPQPYTITYTTNTTAPPATQPTFDRSDRGAGPKPG